MAAVMDESDEQIFSSPTFSSYSSNKLAEVAARVSTEFKNESVEDMFIPEHDDNNDDFEFSLVFDDDSSNVFYDGKSDPIFPIFKLDFLADKQNDHVDEDEIPNIPLKELLIREREQHEDDDMADIPPGTYCVWKPKLKESSPRKKLFCSNKSKSTGSTSKRWKILDLLRRSNSDGNESYMFLTPKHHHHGGDKSVKAQHPPPPQARGDYKQSGGRKTPPPPSSPSAHERLYVRNRAIREEDRKKSYLPYRQVLVGFFANVNGLKKTYPPF